MVLHPQHRGVVKTAAVLRRLFWDRIHFESNELGFDLSLDGLFSLSILSSVSHYALLPALLFALNDRTSYDEAYV